MRMHWLCLLLVSLVRSASAEPVLVYCDATDTPERRAAIDLARTLGDLYAHTVFRTASWPADDRPLAGIAVGSLRRRPELAKYVDKAKLADPESFVVSTAADGRLGLIVGADAAGAAFGVSALLERLGCGAYLSFNTRPAARDEAFSLNGWSLADRPAVQHRIVFNWHNFLSGCSSWDVTQWLLWIDQAQRMGYNTVMVHAYANNPMFTFRFQGLEKPVGFLPTSREGRDWGNAHVNDVRRLIGGEVFDEVEFGAVPARINPALRVEGVQAMMKTVFNHVQLRGMHLCFALDVDTAVAQPQDMILRLPASARFQVAVKGSRALVGQSPDDIWLVNPETPEGSAFYKAQAAALLSLYPQIDRLALWMRKDGSPWLALTPETMPAAWRTQYEAELAKTPAVKGMPQAAGRFCLGKVLAAFERALGELNRGDVLLWCGSWGFDWLEPSHRFFPPRFALMPLDYDVLSSRGAMDSAEWRARLKQINASRPVLPIVWAHHDDGAYIGRSYAPLPDFAGKLAEAQSDGFGIIHWTTWPLDLYFKSLARQTWQSSRNEPLLDTCRHTAARWFAPDVAEAGAAYLHKWITDAPIFGRETQDWFIDRPLSLEQADAVCQASRKRLELLGPVSNSRQLTEQGAGLISYFSRQEAFYCLFHQSEASCQESMRLWAAGDVAAARRILTERRFALGSNNSLAFNPREVIELYVPGNAMAPLTRGEKGVLLALNLNWYTYLDSQRQALGLGPVRYAFAPTRHEYMAQGPGTLSFLVDERQNFWRVLGEKETGQAIWGVRNDLFAWRSDPAGAAVGRYGIKITAPFQFTVRPYLYDRQRLGKNGPPMANQFAAGKYHLKLWAVTADDVPPPANSNVTIRAGRIDGPVLATGNLKLDGRPGASAHGFDVTLSEPTAVVLSLEPTQGCTVVNAVSLEPASAD